LGKDCLMDAEKEFFTDYWNQYSRNKENWYSSPLKNTLEKNSREKMIKLILHEVSKEEGVIFPIIKEDENGNYPYPVSEMFSIKLGDRIRISDKKITLWTIKGEKIDTSLLDVDKSILMSNKGRRKVFRIAGNRVFGAEAYTKTLNEVIQKKRTRLIHSLTVGLIKDLLSDLIPGDEVKLEEAVDIVNQERSSKYPRIAFNVSNEFIENFFRLIGSNLTGFQFVRLKKTIRCVSDISKELDKIDSLFEDWNHNQDLNKKK